MNHQFKAIVVGCGKIGFGNKRYLIDSHAYYYNRSKKISLVCGVDINKKKLNEFSKIFKCETSNNILYALKKYNPDIISICTPDKSHFKIVNQILGLKYKPSIIFLEKPCFQNIKEFNIIEKKLRKFKTEIIVNHSRRFNKNYLKLKNMIKKNYFGKFINSQSIYYNGWLHNAIHCVDELNFLLNKSFKIYKVSKTLFFKDKKNLNYDVVLKTTDNKSKLLFLSIDEKDYQIFDTDMRFEKFRIFTENFGENIYIQKKIKNKLNENILTNKKILFKKSKLRSMKYSIELIEKYLNTKDKSFLFNYRLIDIKNTMKIMWNVKKKYENKN